ncbi:hypothetical protein IWQ57_005638, partial [Coemansia nantahalensis]
AQAAGIRPPNPFMSPSLAQQPIPAARSAGTPTPSQAGAQRGLKRKSVNSSPAPAAGTPQQPLNKSPRVVSPQHRPASAVHPPAGLGMSSPGVAIPSAKSDSEAATPAGPKPESAAAVSAANTKPDGLDEKPPGAAVGDKPQFSTQNQAAA